MQIEGICVFECFGNKEERSIGLRSTGSDSIVGHMNLDKCECILFIDSE